MKKTALIMLSLLSIAGSAFAQNAPLEGIRESTDPAKVADVERRAQEIAANRQSSTSGASGASSTGAASDTGAATEPKARKGKAHHRRGMHHRGDDTSGNR